MAIKLATTTTSTTSGNESILPPKILDHLKSKLSRPAALSSETASQVLASYIMARPTPRDVLRAAVRDMQWPTQLLALEVVPLAAMPRASYGVVCRDIAVYASEAQLQGRLIYLGERMFCMCVDQGGKPEQAYLELKKIAKLFGCEVNMGIGPVAMEPRQLRSAYQSALRIAQLGKDLFGKSYRYSPADLGVLAMLAGYEAQRGGAQEYAEQILAGLEKPKSLLPTLRKLFEQTMSPSEAARALHVHRNTVIYRLAKIRAQTGLDVLDFNDALQLRLAVVLHDLVKGGAPELDDAQGVAEDADLEISEYFFRTAFTKPGMQDDAIRSWGQSIGVDLPDVFHAYLVQGAVDDKVNNIVKNTTVIARTVLQSGQHFLLVEATPKLARRFAVEVSSYGKVAWVSSDDMAGSLCRMLATLQEYAVLGGLIAPRREVISRHDVGCYGVFLNGCDSSTATAFAYSVVGKLETSPQLGVTVGVLLESSLNLTAAARRLKVHRNTLIYRIGRIKHLIGYDMTVFEDAVQVRLALLLSQLT